MHVQLELVDGYSVLAWRHGIPQTPSVLAAMATIRTFPDDELVHSRLVADGFKLDGEVLKPQLFDDRCTKVPCYLREGKSLRHDGMGHLDTFGYGDLYRATLFVQARRVRDRYSDLLSSEPLALLDDFLNTFARFRPRQHRRALSILQLLKDYDVHTVDGHAMILAGLVTAENLGQFVGLSSYVKDNGRYHLPWPTA